MPWSVRSAAFRAADVRHRIGREMVVWAKRNDLTYVERGCGSVKSRLVLHRDGERGVV
jgi:hypothetical protein